MKRYTLILISFVFLLSSGLIAQERVNRSPDLILSDNIIGELTKATGWNYNDSSGKWVSQPNAIPYSYYSELSKHKDALGIDNFRFYRLREAQFRGKDEKYVMLMKVQTDGTYEYSNIREGWYTYNVHHYWIFPV
jgi:hypothetical protein